MAKVNQKAVRGKLEEYAAISGKITALESKRNKKLDPFIRQYNEDTKPIAEEFDRKANPLREQLCAVEKEIKTLIESDRDEDGNPKPIMISTEKAVAIVEKKEGARVVDVKKYFDFVKVKTTDFWKSLKVTIKDAEPIVGKNKIDDLSDKRTDYVSTIKLK